MGMKRLTALTAAALLLGVALGAAPVYPKIIELPDGFFPEGIEVGRGSTFYVGSLLDGAIYSGDLRTGEGSVLVEGEEGLAATGELLADYTLTTDAFPATLVNDVIVTRDAAYFTDSFQPVLYRLPLGPGGALPDASDVEEIALDGFDFVPGAFNANGIVATPNGDWLIINNTDLGTLYKVDPDTGEATQLDLGGDTVPSGDGLLLDGRDLYVMQNFLNTISVVRLSTDLNSGEIVDTITDTAFRVPTTIAEFGSSIYAVNGRFDVAFPPFFGGPIPDPPLDYEIVKVSKQ